MVGLEVQDACGGFLLDHITEEATGAAALHKGKGNTSSSTQGRRDGGKKRRKGESEKEAGRWVVGRHFHLSEL